MGRACINFVCRQCGEQRVCLDDELKPYESLTCEKGHLILVKDEDRQKINLAFRSFVAGQIDVFL